MSRKKFQKVCEYCGDPFIASRSNARFCSSAHRAAASREKKERVNGGVNLKDVLNDYLIEIENIHKKILSLVDGYSTPF